MNLELESARLWLRPFKKSDATGLYQMNTDHEVLKYTGDSPLGSIQDAQQYIDDYVNNPAGQIKKYKMGRLACIDKESQEFVGFCGIKTHEASQLTDIGYRFLKKHWGKGYATEACAVILKFAFVTHNKQEIVAHVHEHNIGSQRVVEKLGFDLSHRFLWDGLLPGRYYKMNRETYDNQSY